MTLVEAFPDFVRAQESLAPYTLLRIGGKADYLAQPRSIDELSALMRSAAEQKLPVRILGVGSNVLVRDEGIPGVVLRLTAPAFTGIHVEGRKVRVGSGAALSAVISATAGNGLAGLETLVGIAASIGGAVRSNAGDRTGEIGQYVRRVQVLDSRHQAVWREHEELQFHENRSNLDDPVILAAEFELDTDLGDSIVKRMRKSWIQRMARKPYSFEAAAKIFRNPHGGQASALIEAAGLSRTKVGGAEVSERNANYVVAGPNCSARDVLRLIDLLRTKVREHGGVALDQDLVVW